MRHCSTLHVGERGGNEPLYPEPIGADYSNVILTFYFLNSEYEHIPLY